MTTPTLLIPAGKDALVAIGDREVKLTNLDKPFWPARGIVKRDLLQYYADVSPVLLPHLADRDQRALAGGDAQRRRRQGVSRR